MSNAHALAVRSSPCCNVLQLLTNLLKCNKAERGSKFEVIFEFIFFCIFLSFLMTACFDAQAFVDDMIAGSVDEGQGNGYVDEKQLKPMKIHSKW